MFAKNCGFRSGRGEDDNGNTAWDFCKWKGLVKYNKNREAVLPFIEKKKNLFSCHVLVVIQMKKNDELLKATMA